MRLLRETIRNLMMENASILGTLPVEELQYNNLIIVADMQSPQSEVDVYLCSRADYDEEYGDVADWVGKITVSNIGKRTHQVSSSRIDSMFRGAGLGALLYNVALAMCTSERLWLMADRSEVSDAASRIWDTWSGMPDQYEIDQTDHEQPDESHAATQFDDYDPDVDFFLTKTRGDDFHQGSFQDNNKSWGSYDDSDPRAQYGDMVKDWWYFFDDEYKKDFLASGLTKRFKMKDANNFINALETSDYLFRIQ